MENSTLPLYIDVQNRNSGASATSAVASAADDGTTFTNYISTGITSSGFADPTFPIAEPDDGYPFNISDFTYNGGNLIIGTLEPNKSIKLITGGGGAAANERMRIDSAGNVGYGTTQFKTDVKGTLRLSGGTLDMLDWRLRQLRVNNLYIACSGWNKRASVINKRRRRTFMDKSNRSMAKSGNSFIANSSGK